MATDGEPNCAAGGSGSRRGGDAAATITAVKAPNADGSFYGAACDDPKGGASKNVQIIMGCGESVIP